MSEEYSIEKGTTFSFKDEVTEGTSETDAAGDAILLKLGGSMRLGREQIDREIMTGSLSKLGHLIGRYDDSGFDFTTEGKGSGTQLTRPEFGYMLKNVIGSESVGVNGTIKSSPSPTTTGATIENSPTVIVGHLARIEITSGNFEYARILTAGSPGAEVAVSWWPPTSAPPTQALAFQSGVAYILKSSRADFTPGTGRFYMDNGTKFWFYGSRGTATLHLAVGQPMLIDWAFNSLSYNRAQVALGFTPTVDITTQPPVCLGITTNYIYDLLGRAGSTTTNTKISATSDPEIVEGDTFIIDVGTSTYETKPVISYNGATGTVTTDDFSGALAENDDCYVIRNLEIPSLDIEIMPEWEMASVMNASSGNVAQVPVDRNINVNWEQYFKSDYELNARDNLVAVEVWAIYGDTAGNIAVICMPNILRRTTDIAMDRLQRITPVAQSYMNSVAGNDELFITYL